MLIRRPRPWQLPERLAADDRLAFSRRRFVAGAGALGAVLLGGCGDSGEEAAAGAEVDPTADLYPVARSDAFAGGRPQTPEAIATTYNNFYEFGSHKRISQAAQALPLRPWEVTIDGAVEKPITIGFDGLVRKMPLEERIYRLRCVEAWSIVVPWSGFPLRALVELAKPLSNGKYVQMETFLNRGVASGQNAFWYPWPYVEGLTIAEATNDLAFIATGAYGRPLPKQMGAPLRLAVPWKYGFKSIKSIVRFHFTETRPVSFWEQVQGSEYGFWANVNPEVPHPRWSQATEEVIGTGERIPTQIFNGYGEQVAALYKGLEGERLYA